MTFDDDDLDTCSLDEYFDDLDEDTLGIPRPRKPKAKQGGKARPPRTSLRHAPSRASSGASCVAHSPSST